jgi:hypothetical protein
MKLRGQMGWGGGGECRGSLIGKNDIYTLGPKKELRTVIHIYSHRNVVWAFLTGRSVTGNLDLW